VGLISFVVKQGVSRVLEMALIAPKYLEAALAATNRLSRVKLISHVGEHVGNVSFDEAAQLLASGQCFAGGTRSRLKYLRYKAAAREPQPELAKSASL